MKTRHGGPGPIGRALPFRPETHLQQVLELQEPAFSRSEDTLFAKPEPFRQLEYVERYVRDMGCKALLVEPHYVDRDYIEDHSLFYSRSFRNYPNYCKRIHFFRTPREETESQLATMEGLCATASAAERAQKWREFSQGAYIGFSVIKPLAGSPVGRTVLRYFDMPIADSADTRCFPAIRRYPVHLGAVELEVHGLPFQQQDVGVSACATTALWSALHKLRDLEEIGAPTPAQITTLATQYSLPFGRPMPSDEGLSLDQMCQALQALRVAPSLLTVDDYEVAWTYIYSALRSEFAPVLILQSETDVRTWHAVTAVGYRSGPTPKLEPGEAYPLSRDMRALYVHDDRIGPYQRVNPLPVNGSLGLVSAYGGSTDRWAVRSVLVPLHAKIRVSVSGLVEIAVETLDRIQRGIGPEAADELAVGFETWISRPIRYLQSLFSDGKDPGARVARSLIEHVSMPRYVGIVRLTGPTLGTVDVLIDTTSTMKNLHFLAIAHHGPVFDRAVLESLATQYQCELLTAD